MMSNIVFVIQDICRSKYLMQLDNSTTDFVSMFNLKLEIQLKQPGDQVYRHGPSTEDG